MLHGDPDEYVHIFVARWVHVLRDYVIVAVVIFPMQTLCRTIYFAQEISQFL